MTTSAIVMFAIGATFLWGGAALAIVNYVRKSKTDPHRWEDDDETATSSLCPV